MWLNWWYERKTDEENAFSVRVDDDRIINCGGHYCDIDYFSDDVVEDSDG